MKPVPIMPIQELTDDIRRLIMESRARMATVVNEETDPALLEYRQTN